MRKVVVESAIYKKLSRNPKRFGQWVLMMDMAKIGTYYKSIPYIIDELMRGKIVTIETEDGEYFVYDVRKRVPKLIYYSSKIQFIHSK